MNHTSFSSRLLRSIGALICLSLLLAACSIEGGVPPSLPADQQTALPAPTSAAQAAANRARADTWAIGLLEGPQAISPYLDSAAAQRVAAPVTELLFPAPILAFNYGYTTTGVLERIPTLENGDATMRKADVYLDAAGSITTTATDVMTQVNQLIVTFHWNSKLSWSDGQPLTAADSVFAYTLAKAAPPSIEVRDRLAQIAAYEQVDAYTTRATLQPDIIEPTYFLNYWTPLPQHLLKDTPPDQLLKGPFAQKPVGYGAYAIEQRSQNEIRMVRNPHYFGTPPAASHLIVSVLPNTDLLRGGIINQGLDVGMTDRVSPEQFSFLDQDAARGLVQTKYLSNPIWTHIDFNLDVPLLQDIRLRRAIALGTNRQAMVDLLFKGRTPVLESWVLPDQPDAAPLNQLTRYPYDPDQARKILDEGGYSDPDGDGIRSSPSGITLTLQLATIDGIQMLQEVAQRFQQDMKAIGIAIDLKLLPSEQLFDANGPLFQRQFELALFSWIAGPEAGGLLLWSCAAVPSIENGWSGDNFAGWCFRDADRAIRTAVTALDPTERQAAYLRQQQLWTQEVPALPLFQRLSLALIAPNLSGPQPDPLAPITWNIALWQRTR
jgi:peptide/nickel transport system substrate-binding protein